MKASSPQYSLFWRQLFSLLKDGKVIPIVGQDAIVIHDDETGRSTTLNEYVARRTESLLALQPTGVRSPLTLHEVACRYLDQAGEGDIGDVYWAVKEALSERTFEVPDTLRKLAGIDAFMLYVTTTFDDLLRCALDAERFGGAAETASFAYSPGRVQDLDVPVDQLKQPAVYHLLGRFSAVQDYAVTEEDTLEFVHSLQSENRSPTLLMDAFRTRSMLVIGSGYSDWLMRFFLRIAKRERLLFARSKTDIVVDARDDISLREFLRHFSAQTKVFTGGATEFINELWERWEEFRATPAYGEARVARATLAPAEHPPFVGGAARVPPPTRAPAEHPIFVSYATEDQPRARRLADALRNAGLPVWFDKPTGFDDIGGLQGGMDWDAEIVSRIREASLFTPVLSRNVQTAEKRYFFKEWQEAIEVGKRVAANYSFIVPVCVDDLPRDAPEIPDRFRDVHWLGAADEDLGPTVQRLRELYRKYQRARSV